ncbi:hypothetical protein [Arthrospiribacter ruber]|uniref:hypothetical protein n=1 Tax=Arthrospiribacter ruber TaxID=2487934 RepID=UPI001FE2DB65|nr:hypothetical protein [Arthrospiribacter ruber]
MKTLFLSLAFAFTLTLLEAQVMFVERFEFESKYQEKDFMVMNKPGGIIAFRAQPDKGFNLRSKLQIILTDYLLESERLSEVRIKDNFDLVGYDLEGDFFIPFSKKAPQLHQKGIW